MSSVTNETKSASKNLIQIDEQQIRLVKVVSLSVDADVSKLNFE